ncbi:hypothetical protein [Variovorax rhizosphaerae]|uniref:Uncharacterized protein n=1 Tax=Variovorax rhizosphaerae TaxID=1836200 RepID=A0ABU8WP78_9BURK
MVAPVPATDHHDWTPCDIPVSTPAPFTATMKSEIAMPARMMTVAGLEVQ